MQPSGRLHIGNYLGALKNCVDLQQTGRYDCFFGIVDLHSITEATALSAKEKRAQIIELAADFIAAGIDPRRSAFFLQSLVPAHVELSWILTTITPMGDLSRMTQYKDKKHAFGANAGLLNYPILMAADIMVYDAKVVPVGEDQLQHLELTRSLARRFNERYGKTMVEPEALLTETPRIMSLGNPMKKMSKSDPASCLFVDDTPTDIVNKVKRAVTDSDGIVRFDAERKPGVANLLRIQSAVTMTPIPALEKQYDGIGYAVFKREVGEAIADYFGPFRVHKKRLMKKPRALISILESGSRKARKRADTKIDAVYKKIGLAL